MSNSTFTAKNPDDSDLHEVLNRRVHEATTQHISATFTERGHSRVTDRIRNPQINAFYSNLPSTNPVSLSSQASLESKNMPLCNLSKIIFLLHLMTLITLG